jgi:ADP-heptose:LPS heptosyltransferase
MTRRLLGGMVHHCLPTLFLGAIFRLRHQRWTNSGDTPSSIVVFRLDRIGDVVLSAAMIRELRRLYPDAHITMVVREETRALAEACPHIDEVAVRTNGTGLRSALRFCRRHLREREWDLAIVPRWDTDVHFATLMACYIGAARRIAFSEKCSPVKRFLNWRFDRFYTDVLSAGVLKHEAERNLEVVRYLGGRISSTELELWLTPEDSVDAAERWIEFGLTGSDVVVAFGIGAGEKKRVWPLASFAALIDRLCSELGIKAVIVCGPQEHALGRAVQAYVSTPVHLLAHASLRQSAAFLSRCSLFVGNDSGPLHLAAAAGVAVVQISCHPEGGDPNGDNSPDRFGPFTARGSVARPSQPKYPCRNSCASGLAHCITQVRVDDVEKKVLGLLGSSLAHTG